MEEGEVGKCGGMEGGKESALWVLLQITVEKRRG